jgi:hypothetical protein
VTSLARGWATQLRPGGCLVVDGIEWMRIEEPALAGHLELATALVATTGCDGDRQRLVRGLAELSTSPATGEITWGLRQAATAAGELAAVRPEPPVATTGTARRCSTSRSC